MHMKKTMLMLAILLTGLVYPVVAYGGEMKEMNDPGSKNREMERGMWKDRWEKTDDSDESGESRYQNPERIHIEVEIYSNWSKVEVKVNDTESEFRLNTVNTEKIISAIVNETGLSRNTVENNIRIEIKGDSDDSWKYFRGREKVREKIEEHRELMEKREKMKEQYLKKYSETRQMYQKMKHRGLGDPVVFNATKGYVAFGIDFVISHLDSLELRILDLGLNDSQNLSSDISSIRSELEYWRGVITNSSTPQELRDNVSAFSKEWKTLRVKITVITGKVLSLKLINVIEQAEGSSLKLELKISELEDKGMDTTSIREAYSRYLERLSSAKEHAQRSVEHFDMALGSDDLSNAMNHFALGKSEYAKAMSEVKKSFKDLKQIFREYRDALKEIKAGGGSE